MNARLCLALLTLVATACSTEKPAGPGERIGRGIDEIAAGLNDMNTDPNYRGPDMDTDPDSSWDRPQSQGLNAPSGDAPNEPGDFDSTKDQYWDEQAKVYRTR